MQVRNEFCGGGGRVVGNPNGQQGTVLVQELKAHAELGKEHLPSPPLQHAQLSLTRTVEEHVIYAKEKECQCIFITCFLKGN